MIGYEIQHFEGITDHKAPTSYNNSMPSNPSPRVSFGSGSGQMPANAAVEQFVRENIAAAGSRNADLLAELSATAHAPVLYADVLRRSEFLEERLKEQRAGVDSLATVAELQLKRHKGFRDSVTKRLTYTVLRKKDQFTEKAKKEEEAYHDALGRRHRAESQMAGLEADKNNLHEESNTLEAMFSRHGAAHKAIDSLYSTLFDGPTPGFPDEDEQEYRYKRAKEQHEASTEVLKAVTKGLKAVDMIKVAVDRALSDHSKGMAESRSRLLSSSYLTAIFTRCAKYATRALELSRFALEDIPHSILDPSIPQVKTTLDQALQSVVEMGSNRQRSRSDVQETAAAIGAALIAALARQRVYITTLRQSSAIARDAVRGTARSLEDQRQGLHQLRQGAFEKTVGFGAAAPAYHECCDRADRFEDDSNLQCMSIVAPVVEEFPDISPPNYAYENPEGVDSRRGLA